MTWADPVNVGAATISSILAITGVVFTYSTNRRAQYDRVLAETAKLTSGEVAEARHVIGMLHAGRGEISRGLTEQEIKNIYVVLWAFERLDGLYESLRSPLFPRGRTRPQRLLLSTARGGIYTWHDYVSSDYRNSQGQDVSLKPSCDCIFRLHKELTDMDSVRSNSSWNSRRAIG